MGILSFLINLFIMPHFERFPPCEKAADSIKYTNRRIIFLCAPDKTGAFGRKEFLIPYKQE